MSSNIWAQETSKTYNTSSLGLLFKFKMLKNVTLIEKRRTLSSEFFQIQDLGIPCMSVLSTILDSIWGKPKRCII